jgi:hypothetical protein
MAVTIDDRPCCWKPAAQALVPVVRGALVAVDQDQAPSGQVELHRLRKLTQQVMISLGPLPRDVVVSEYGDDAAKSGLQPGEDIGTPDITSVDRQITGCHQVFNARIQVAMRVGQDANP